MSIRTLDGLTWLPDDSENLIGAFDLAAMSEIGTWTKLFQSARIDSKLMFVGGERGFARVKEIESSFPPSRLADILMLDDSSGSWRELIQPDRIERSFALRLVRGFAEPLMIGAPTEEAWDLFQSLANSEP
jgi:hypothetical protein